MPGLNELIVISAAVYGWAWVLTRSKILLPIRERLSTLPLLGYFLSCVVCTGFWIALVLFFLYDTPLRDLPVSVGFSLAFSWTLARLLGDAS